MSSAFMRKVLFVSLVSLPFLKGEEQEVHVDIKNPHYHRGKISTTEGGVVHAEGFRLQAEKISYTHTVEEGIPKKIVEAEGEILLQYGGHAFIGERLEFDFVTRTGVLYDARTAVGLWFVRGKKIELTPSGDYHLHSAVVTMSENQSPPWEVDISKIQVNQESKLTAENVSFRFARFPLFWLPQFTVNLKSLSKPSLIRYKLLWDKPSGPRLTLRYQIANINDFRTYLRVDYRMRKGWGGAIEGDYTSDDGRIAFKSKNYAARDRLVQEEIKKGRYRIQGLYDFESKSGNTTIHATWDKMRDPYMPNEFKSDDFEISTKKQTIFTLRHLERDTITHINVQPRINSFESLNQELPRIVGAIRPFAIGSSTLLSENRIDMGFLDYIYAKDLSNILSPIHAIRLETQNGIYQPLPLYCVTLTPKIGLTSIFYNNNPFDQSVGQFLFTYGGDLYTRFFRNYGSHTHVVQPYLSYLGYTKPRLTDEQVLIFNINDGFVRLNTLRMGLRNSIYSKGIFAPRFVADLYTFGFFGQNTYSKIFPKFYLDLNCLLRSIYASSRIIWNWQENVFDTVNGRVKWTINENFALSAEYRHRSKYFYRKAIFDNFVMDLARPQQELLDSPLSDGRNTFLASMQIRVSPRINCHISSINGWGRKDEPAYNGAKVEVQTLITGTWLGKFSWEYAPNQKWRITYGFNLIR